MKIIGCTFFSGEIGDQPKSEYQPFHDVGIKTVRAVGQVLDRQVLYEVVFEEEFEYPDYVVDVVSFDKAGLVNKKPGLTPYRDVVVDTQYRDRVVLKAKEGLNRAYAVRIIG